MVRPAFAGVSGTLSSEANRRLLRQLLPRVAHGNQRFVAEAPVSFTVRTGDADLSHDVAERSSERARHQRLLLEQRPDEVQVPASGQSKVPRQAVVGPRPPRPARERFA